MIRVQNRDGELHEFQGWQELEHSAPPQTEVLDIHVSLPESIELSAAHVRQLADLLHSGGLLRVHGVRPLKGSADPRHGEALATRTGELLAMAAASGFDLHATTPVCIREYEFLHHFLGLENELLGRSRLQDTEFAELVFRKRGDSKDDRPRLGIITQDLYYSFIYESPALASRLHICKMEYNPFCRPEYYRELLEFEPDVLLVFRPDYLAPETYRAFKCPIIGFASEPLPRYENDQLVVSDYNRKAYDLLSKVRGMCDRLYHYDPACIDFLRREDFPCAGLFPPCICTDVYRPNPGLAKRWDASFIGKSTPHREDYLFALHLTCNFFHGAHGLVGADEVLPFLQRSLIGLNIHRDQTPNTEPRLLILMACGLLTLTEELRPNPWFQEGVHYAAFRSKAELTEKIRYYLAHEEERRAIAENGRRWICENASSLAVLPRLVDEVLGKSVVASPAR